MPEKPKAEWAHNQNVSGAPVRDHLVRLKEMVEQSLEAQKAELKKYQSARDRLDPRKPAK